METEKVCNAMQVAKNAKPLTAELASEAFYGISLKELVREITENRDGKYNTLYEGENAT